MYSEWEQQMKLFIIYSEVYNVYSNDKCSHRYPICSIPLDHNSLKEIVRHTIPTYMYFLTDISFNKTVHDQPEAASVISV